MGEEIHGRTSGDWSPGGDSQRLIQRSEGTRAPQDKANSTAEGSFTGNCTHPTLAPLRSLGPWVELKL